MNDGVPFDPPHDGTEMIRINAGGATSIPCRRCGAALQARAEFCEMCGAAGIDERARIVLDVFADREYFDTLDAEGLEFPEGRRVHTLWFDDDVVHIGRRRSHDGAPVDVDLADDLADPGVSQRHAQLVLQPDGGCALTDVGSTNGTTVNVSATPLVECSALRVRVGDHIHVGAWTTIVIRFVSDDGAEP